MHIVIECSLHPYSDRHFIFITLRGLFFYQKVMSVDVIITAHFLILKIPLKLIKYFNIYFHQKD